LQYCKNIAELYSIFRDIVKYQQLLIFKEDVLGDHIANINDGLKFLLFPAVLEPGAKRFHPHFFQLFSPGNMDELNIL